MQENSKHVVGRYRSSLIAGVAIGFSIGVAFAAGFLLRGLVDVPIIQAGRTYTTTDSYALLDEVQALIDQYYLREQPDPAERVYSAVRGMVNSLNDRYTFFVDPPVAQSESDVLAGTYGGIGVQVQRSEDGRLILYPLDESPASASGVQEGDELVAINGAPVSITVQSDVLDQMLRGEVKEGSGVKLSIIKASDKEQIELFIPFAVISVPSVVFRVLDGSPKLGYIQISLFTSRTPSELRDALLLLEKDKVAGLILDLRNNSGGLLQESVEVAGAFINSGVVVYEKSRTSEKALKADEGIDTTDLPLVVLTNQGTASAAELVAGAIRDSDRGILIGQTTYGKGSVQQIFRLSDGSSLHVTAAEWLTPKRVHLDGIGLDPDIIMIPDVNGRDVELGEAIRYLAERLKV